MKRRPLERAASAILNIFPRAVTAVTAVTGAAVLTLCLATPASAAAGFVVKTRQVTAVGTRYNLVLAAPAALSAEGQDVPVAGYGYNTAQGIFVALCVIPDSVSVDDPSTYTARPTPCLGGRQSTNGAAHRVTNTDTGTPGITSRYGPHGSFHVILKLNPNIASDTVCDVDVRCAIVTRADFTATDERSYDMYIPVAFR